MLNELLLRLAYVAYGFNEFSGPPWNASLPCPTAIAARPHRNSYCLQNPNAIYCRFPNMTLTHSALTHCPNVETLDVWLDYGGCLGAEMDRSDFPFLEGEKYPSLKILNLDGYSFGGLDIWREEEEWKMKYRMGPVGESEWWDESSWSRVNEWVDSGNNELKRQWKQQGKPKTNLGMWLQAMDWSQLEELSINAARTEMLDAIRELPKRLTSLKTLHLESLPFIQGLKNHTLETLRWIGTTRPEYLNAILSQQGQSLKSLEYRCNEVSCPNWPDHIDTSTLPLLAPALEHISINLPRNNNGTWPLAHLSALARMPSLTSADLYFRLQAPCAAREHFLGFVRLDGGKAYREYRHSEEYRNCRGTNLFSAPYLNATTAMGMFSYLRSENSNHNLTSVTFRTGDWAPPLPQWWPEPFMVDRRGVVYCNLEQGKEVCKAENEGYWQHRSGGQWEWDGETWIVDNDFEELDDAQIEEDVAWEERIKEKMKTRIKSYYVN